MTRIELLPVEPAQLGNYSEAFHDFPFFHNHLEYVLKHAPCDIWVDSLENPRFRVLHSAPAFFLMGDPEGCDVKGILERIGTNSWIVPENETWEEPLQAYFSGRLVPHRRTQFDASFLDLGCLESLKRPLSPGYELIPIGPEQAEDKEGMLYADLLRNFFPAGDFLEKGLGFCILENREVIGFAASNYPLEGNELEVYIRVDFNSDPRHRNQGMGTQLGIALLEHCLKRNLIPEWDSANEISARLARKLGYVAKREWKMFHIVGE